MPKRRDLSGLKFYMLEAIQVQGRDKYSTPLWLCKCDCGCSILVRSCDLIWGDKRSCGCVPRGSKWDTILPGEAKVRPARNGKHQGGGDKDKVRAWRAKNREKLREYQRRGREKKPETGRKKSRLYSRRYPDRLKAKRAVASAIRRKILPRQDACLCANSNCTKQAEQYHHWSYEQENWLSVIPFCKACHLGLHNGAWQLNDPQKYTIRISMINQAG